MDAVETATGWGDGWGPTHQLHLESHIHIGCGFFTFTVRVRTIEVSEEKLGQNKTDFLR
jgi:hypothetical protein